MEPVTLIFIVLLSAGIGSEITKTDDKVIALQEQVDQLEGTVMNLAGSHAALAANSKLDSEILHRKMDGLYSEVDYLDRKINIYHD